MYNLVLLYLCINFIYYNYIIIVFDESIKLDKNLPKKKKRKKMMMRRPQPHPTNSY
jgi:hypothetical protein